MKVTLIEGGRIVEIRQDDTAVQTTVQIRRDQLPELVYQLAALAESLAKVGGMEKDGTHTCTG